MTAPKKDPSAMGLQVGSLFLTWSDHDGAFVCGKFRVWQDHLREWNWDAGELSSQSPALYTAEDAAENLRSALESIGYFGLLNRPRNVDKQRRRLLAEKCEAKADACEWIATEAGAWGKVAWATSGERNQARATKLRALAERLRGETR
jgi:hypothetical protein